MRLVRHHLCTWRAAVNSDSGMPAFWSKPGYSVTGCVLRLTVFRTRKTELSARCQVGVQRKVGADGAMRVAWDPT